MLLFTARTTLLRACSKIATTRSNKAVSAVAAVFLSGTFLGLAFDVDFFLADMAFVFFSRQPGDGGESVAEFEVVHRHAVVEVDFEALLGEEEDGVAFSRSWQVFEGFPEFFAFLAGAVLSLVAVVSTWLRWAIRDPGYLR